MNGISILISQLLITSILVFSTIGPAQAQQLGPALTDLENQPLSKLNSDDLEQNDLFTTTVGQVNVGDEHTCALTSTGGIKCWGINSYGQLGDGTTVDRFTPVDVTGFSSGIIAVEAGGTHTCALTSIGGVYCWGFNYDGQLGDGTTTNRLIPVEVIGLTSGTTDTSTGDRHTCAVTSTGGVKCWGNNFWGQLGDGTAIDRSSPVDVVGLSSGIVAVDAGDNYSCALTSIGGIKCWGDNFSGQLGDGTLIDQFNPVDVVGLTNGVVSVSAGYSHTCALTTTGGVKCWGNNFFGELGDGTTTDRSSPVDVVGLSSGVVAVNAGDRYTCALTLMGGIKCWGINFYGQLGDGTITNRSEPVNVVGLLSGIDSIDTGDSHTCALTSEGEIKCWGFNSIGQLGDGVPTYRSTPANVVGLTSGVATVSAGYSHTCALFSLGGVKCWGYNNFSGKLGDGTTISRSIPADVYGLTSGADAVSTGDYHTCALTSQGGVKCWGKNNYGQLGDGTTIDRLTPVGVIGLSGGVESVSVGAQHTCVVTSVGGAKCWGYNNLGQLGDGTRTSRLIPVDVVGLTTGVLATNAGYNFTCALTSVGGAKCWGSNIYGQLGDGTTTDRITPVNVVGLTSGVSAISPGRREHTCALTSTGLVKCWGDNYYGQLGDGTTTGRLIPVNVIGLSSGVIAISSGSYHNCALISTGGVKCWGENSGGSLGDGSTINSLTPVDVVDLNTGVSSISAGYGFSCALTSVGGTKCWGNNLYGQLGWKVLWVPVDVVGFRESTENQPVILIPGIMGSRLYNDNEEIWLDACRMVGFEGGLNPLRLANDGITAVDPMYDDIYVPEGRGGILDLAEDYCVIQQIGVNEDFYETLINHFLQNGYTENVDLFIFPYDWRKDLRTSASILDPFVDSIRDQSGWDQVNLVAHSMGGLVARQYISDPTRAGKISKMVTLGTPFLGTPKAFAMLLGLSSIKQLTSVTIGDLVLSLEIPSKFVTQSLVENYISVYQLMPSQAYFTVKGGGFYAEDRDAQVSNQCPGCLPYEQTYSTDTAPNINSVLFSTASNFHQVLDSQTTWNNVPVTIIAGTNQQTIIGFEPLISMDWGELDINLLAIPVLTPQGDGTVSLISSTLSSNLTGQSLLGSADLYTVADEHGNLVKDDIALAIMDNALGIGGEVPTSNEKDAPISVGAQIIANPANSIMVSDGLGNTTGPSTIDGFSQTGIPGSTYIEAGTARIVGLLGGRTYSITITPQGDEPIDIYLLLTAEDGSVTRKVYTGINVTEASLINLEGDPYLVDTLELDLDGTGSNIIPINPTLTINPTDPIDSISPTSSIQINGVLGPNGWYIGPVTITLSAQDEGGSGVQRIEYAFGNERIPNVYNGPFVIDAEEVSTIHVIAIDNAGNMQLEPTVDRIGPERIFVPLVIR